jgi:hypothetical protein
MIASKNNYSLGFGQKNQSSMRIHSALFRQTPKGIKRAHTKTNRQLPPSSFWQVRRQITKILLAAFAA